MWAGAVNAGLALFGAGLSKLGAKAKLNGLENILFSTMTNSPLTGAGMALNLVGSSKSSQYTVGALSEDVSEGIYALVLGRRRYNVA